jgi:Leucine-rich repeat (LRR) protein
MAPPSPNKNSKTSYERKLARQRQLEMMEAAASGTAPSMELQMSSFAETDGNFLRSRVTENSASIDTAIQSSNSTISNASNTSSMGGRRPNSSAQSTNLFARPEQTGTSLNLMDHSTGIYEEQRGGFIHKIKNLFVARTGTEHDASPAIGEDYVGDVYQRRPQSRLNPFVAKFRSILSDRKRVLALVAVMGAVFVVIFATTNMNASSSKNKAPSDKVVRAQHSENFNAIFDVVVMMGVSESKAFLSTVTPEFHALRWISYSDTAGLEPTDPMTLQRYALAVFFYASYLEFETIAGAQKPIENEDAQYEGVPNPGWTRKDYWLTNKGVCSWYGVECPPRMVNGKMVTRYDDNMPIVGLNLTSNRMYGTLPPEFKGLDSMEYLDFSDNRMHGTMPPQMGSLYALKQLYMYRNDMTGQLPAELGSMESAEEVRLSSNKFSGTIPSELSRLFNVWSIGLDHNQMTGTVPDLVRCRQLKHLYLNDNMLNGKFPFVIAKLSGLNELELQNNKLSGTIPPEVESLRFLDNFQVQNNVISGEIPGHIFTKLTHLKTLNMQQNQFRGNAPTQIGNLKNLRELKLNDNKLDGSLPTEWGRLSTLEIMHIFNNKIGGKMPTEVGKMLELKEFHAQNNEFNQLPTELGMLEDLVNLYLEHNKFGGEIPAELGNLGRLETLKLYHNLLTGSVPTNICNLKDTKSLRFIEADCHDRVECECCDKCY